MSWVMSGICTECKKSYWYTAGNGNPLDPGPMPDINICLSCLCLKNLKEVSEEIKNCDNKE